MKRIPLHLTVILFSAASVMVAPAVSAMEPLQVLLRPIESDVDLSAPAGVEARVLSAVESEIAKLRRFTISVADESLDSQAIIEYALIDFSEQRVWIEDTDDDRKNDEAADTPGTVPVIEMILRLFFRSGSENAITGGEWVYDTSVTVEVTLFQQGSPPESFVLTSTSRGKSIPASRDATITQLVKLLPSNLKHLYVLNGTSVANSDSTVSIDIGGAMGLKKGTLLTIETGGVILVRAVAIHPESSEARIVRRWGATDANGIAKESIDNAVDMRLDLTVENTYGNTWHVGGSLLFVALPYSPLHAGGGVRVFSVRDETQRNDGGFGVAAFGGLHLVHAPQFRLTLLAGSNLDVVFRRDDNNEPVSVLVPSLWPALETSFVVGPHVDVVAGAGYRFSPTITSWNFTGEDSSGAPVFANGAPGVSTTGLFTTVGFRFCFF